MKKRALLFILLYLLYILVFVCAFYEGMRLYKKAIMPGAGSDGVVQVWEGGK